MSFPDAAWERLFRARTGLEFEELLRHTPPAPTRVITQSLDDEGAPVLQALRDVGLSGSSLTDALASGLQSTEHVQVVDDALRGDYSYKLRLWLITALGRAPRGVGVFPVLRDRFWRVEKTTDTQASSERFMCWSANYPHATVRDVDDLIRAARAVEHGHHRGMAVEALGRFRKRAEEFESLLIELVDEPGVDKHAVAAARKLKLASAAEPIRRLRERAEDPWLRQECAKALRAIGTNVPDE